jgi:hypothetical protein
MPVPFWSTWSQRDKAHAILVLVATAGVIGHQAALWRWLVEDSAISFAFARHLIEGEGLVAYRGGERVEGYSNPTWVLLLAFFQLFGADPFQFSKVINLLLGALTVPMVYATVREATGPKSDVPVVAAIFLGCNSQFAIWGGAGLENGLLNFLIALGFWRTLVEVTRGGFAWSALIWLLVALTRPEGILYSAVAGLLTMIFRLHARHGLLPTLQWLVLFFVPWGLYQVWHYQYFAWPLANTYYGKLEEREPMRWYWDRKAWNWTRGFFFDSGQGFFLPIWALGIVGDGRNRFLFAILLTFVVGSFIELSHDQRFLLPVVVGTLWATFWMGLRASEDKPPRWLMWMGTIVALWLVLAAEGARYFFDMVPNELPFPDLLEGYPPYLFAGLAVTLPFVGYGARGWQLRALSWMFCMAVIFFAVYVQWDWMKGYRWYATAAVPGAILFAFGVDSFVRFVEPMFGWAAEDSSSWRPWTVGGIAVAVIVTLLQLPANVAHTVKVASDPDASPRSIKVRVDYVDRVRDRLHIEEPLVDLDVDQGAHLWWSDFEMMDIAGLVDVSFAHQRFEREFVREYVFQEKKPQYAHVHGGWASNSKIPTHPEWRKDYVEIPGYPAGRSQVHIGNFVRRDTIVFPEWTHEPSRVEMERGIVLYAPYIPSAPGASSPEVPRKMYVEIGVSSTLATKTGEDGLRILLFAAGPGVLASWEIPPGYDWLRPEKWKASDVFIGKFDLNLPPSLTPGRYDLGFVVIGADGAVVNPLPAELDLGRPANVRIGGTDSAIRLARGEIQFPDALTVLPAGEADREAEVDRQEALASAGAGRCEEAERSWWLARQHRSGQEDWKLQHLPEMKSAFATCWALSSEGQSQEEQVRRLVRARRWDYWNDAYRQHAEVLADALYEQGLAARAQQDWETAYRRFADAVEVDRSRSWARRYAEEARAFRLGIDPVSKKQKKETQERAKQTTDQRVKDAQQKAKLRTAPVAPVQPEKEP